MRSSSPVHTATSGSGKPNELTWAELRGLALQHRGALIRANLVAILATLVSVPIPLLLPLLVDEVLLAQPGPVLPWLQGWLPAGAHLSVVYVGLMVLAALFLRLTALLLNVWQGRDFSRAAKDVVFRVRARLLGRLSRIAMSEYETLGAGSIASHLVTDLDSIDRFLGASISRFLVACLTVLGTALVLLWMHWPLALLILAFNPFVIYLTTRIGKKFKELKRQENRAFQVFQEALADTLDAIQQLRAANREAHYLERLVEGARQVREHATRYEWRSDAASRASFTLFQFGVDVFRAAAMLTVLFSDLSIGQMFAVFGYLWFMMTPIQEILGLQYSYYAAEAGRQRINQLLQVQDEPDWPAMHDPFANKATVSVQVRDLHFSYDERAVLRGVSFEIRAGEKVALVGSSGGGKSTLVQLLLGLYPVVSGEICYDDIPLQQIGLARVRERVAVVLQHPLLFNDTVRENLTLGRVLPEAQLWQALAIARLDEAVAAMPQGLETRVGRQGVRLSGGQRQRLAIARMVLTDPAVVILDEATSALDAETEFQLHQALSDFLRGRTTLIVAHRLSAVKQADRVLVFDDGLLVEDGAHHELLARKGTYAQLYGERQQG